MAPGARVASARASGAERSATFAVGTSIESDETRAAAADDSITATGTGADTLAGAVDDDPALTPAPPDTFALGAITLGALGVGAATSPPLDLRDGVAGDLVDTTVRFPVVGFAAAVVAGRSRAERSTQPIRVTRTHPFGAELVWMSTAVPASSDATLFAEALPFDRTTTERFPTRVVAEDFCDVSRARST